MPPASSGLLPWPLIPSTLFTLQLEWSRLDTCAWSRPSCLSAFDPPLSQCQRECALGPPLPASLRGSSGRPLTRSLRSSGLGLACSSVSTHCLGRRRKHTPSDFLGQDQRPQGGPGHSTRPGPLYLPAVPSPRHSTPRALRKGAEV